ncbi:murein transglycosylase A [Vibrio quintilis]|uniref:peptidoglycan lytic exotransglycosylase n=1 Tax=Vibrio quintilis TaxID=1117707 RepID=A0A1M7Z0K5_9VIBR|nr:Membrane-bound lytic murein transglycosylase A precursor [Vibrio quintilis]
MNLYKLLALMVSAFFLGGCVNPTDRAQQYADGVLPEILNKTDHIRSNSPRDFSEFTRQSELVTEKSPSLSKIYQPLYLRLRDWAEKSGDPQALGQYGIQSAQLGGADQRGNVLFTGYFSPVIELRHTANRRFRFPVYQKPGCIDDCPTRAEIYAGALEDKGLELGYASNLIDPFIMEVQGSGFVHFGDDDSLEYFAYAGKNKKAYVSIGRVLIDRGEVPKEKMSLKAIKHWVMTHPENQVRELLEQNPSYVFFSPKAAAPVTGTAGIPLIPMASVAGDRRIFPMGTPILAEVPLLNADGSWSGTHELKLLIVLDTGGAVKDNHLDLYHGMGERAGTAAGHYRHFGRVWKLGLDGTATQAPWALPPEKSE